MIVSFSPHSTASSTTTAGDTIPKLEEVKRLVPPGFFILTEEGAREALKAKIDASAAYEKLGIVDNALSKANTDLLLVTIQRNQARTQNIADAETIRILKRRLFWTNFWKYVGYGAASFLGFKLITK